jgi:hypothetical protein
MITKSMQDDNSTLHKIAPYAIGFVLGGLTTYIALTVIGVYTIENLPPASTTSTSGISEVNLKVSDVYVQAGTVVTLTATVINNGKPAAYQPVEFYSNGVLGGTAMTSSTGEAVMEYSIPTAGTYSIYADSMGLKSNTVQVVVS